jgi:type VI secretion system protein ImpK
MTDLIQVRMSLPRASSEKADAGSSGNGSIQRDESLPEWRNPFVAAAMPLLLQVEQLREAGPQLLDKARRRLPGLAASFRSSLSASSIPDVTLERASFLLCTYADEVVNDIQRGAGASAGAGPALLVTFHGNASGGEDCFSQLQTVMAEPAGDRDLLGFYDLILGLGLQGRHLVLEQGSAQLERLREKLATMLAQPLEDGTLVVEDRVRDSTRWRGPRSWQVFLGLVMILVGTWAAMNWQLGRAAEQLRTSLAQWPVPEPPPPSPPVQITLRDRLPEAIQHLVDEGWLDVVKEPSGWLLLFTSDHAFASASASLTNDYKKRLSRLGSALEPWPGTLQVVGHTDSHPLRPGRYADNQALSLARAGTVRDLLLATANKRFLDRSILAVGKGDAEPVADNTTDGGRERNRRVDIHWKLDDTPAEVLP